MTPTSDAALPDVDRAEPLELSSDGTGSTTVAEARARVSHLITALGIDAVISVDDVHFRGGDGSAAEVTEAMAASPTLQGTIVDLLRADVSAAGIGDVDTEDPSTVGDFVNDNWLGFSAGLQDQLLGSARTFKQDLDEDVEAEQIADDLNAQVALAAMFEETTQFLPMSMTDWSARWRELLADGRKYLVLLDRTFSREQSDASDLGETLLGELVRGATENVWAGLLTRHASDEFAERDLTRDLRSRFPDHSDRLVAIGKFRTSSIELFPAGLRALLLVRELDAYRKLVASSLASAATAEAAAFADLSDYAVVESIASAQDEGTYELDHPLRTAHHAHASALAKGLRDAAFPEQHLKTLRSAAVGAFRNAENDHAQIRALLHADAFEPKEHLNSLGLPIEIGDIFRVESLWGTGEAKYYILLGQACDLSVRSKGQRTPDIRTVTLSRLKHEPDHPAAAVLDDVAGLDGEVRADVLTRLKSLPTNGTLHSVGYLDSDSDQRWVVDLRAGSDMVLPVEILDATVFSDTGASRISLDYVEKRPMAASWLARLDLLQKRAKAAIARYEVFETQLAKVPSRDQVLRALAADLTAGVTDAKSGATVQIDASAKSITYGVTRVGRLRAEIAMRTADLAAQYRGRPAFDLQMVRERD